MNFIQNIKQRQIADASERDDKCEENRDPFLINVKRILRHLPPAVRKDVSHFHSLNGPEAKRCGQHIDSRKNQDSARDHQQQRNHFRDAPLNRQVIQSPNQYDRALEQAAEPGKFKFGAKNLHDRASRTNQHAVKIAAGNQTGEGVETASKAFAK